MIVLICTKPNPPAELKHGGRYECLGVRVTSEGEGQTCVISGEPGTPQVSHLLWWPQDLFEIAPSRIDTKEVRQDMARIDAALAELQKRLAPKDDAPWSTVSQFADPEDDGELTTTKPLG